MANNDKLNLQTKSDANNPQKTETTIVDKEQPKAGDDSKNIKLDVKSDPNNPLKTVGTLEEVKTVKLTVTGPFHGEISVPAGHAIKEALVKLNDVNEKSYGNYKYRNNDDPVALTYVLNSDLIISSHNKG